MNNESLLKLIEQLNKDRDLFYGIRIISPYARYGCVYFDGSIHEIYVSGYIFDSHPNVECLVYKTDEGSWSDDTLHVITLPEYRKRGHASRLLEEAIRDCHKHEMTIKFSSIHKSMLKVIKRLRKEGLLDYNSNHKLYFGKKLTK